MLRIFKEIKLLILKLYCPILTIDKKVCFYFYFALVSFTKKMWVVYYFLLFLNNIIFHFMDT